MLRIRLRRMGRRNRPFYRVVVSDSRRTPRAEAVEEVGHYDPMATPPRLVIDRQRVDYWVQAGARPSKTVEELLERA